MDENNEVYRPLLEISRHMTLDEFHSRYKNVKIIHQTRNSTVRLAIHNPTGQNVIIKSVYKSSLSNSKSKVQSLIKEINTLAFLRDLKHVTQIYDVIYSLDTFYIVLEYAESGDLFNYVASKNKQLSDIEVKHFFKNIVKTISMIHLYGIAHRDLKLENILLDKTGRIMVADFGCVTKFDRSKLISHPSDQNNLCSTICGTLHYEPPEIVRGEKYDPMKADAWSVGVMLYVLVFNKFPFHSPSPTETIQMILSSDVSYSDTTRCSEELFSMMRSLLEKDHSKRLYLDELIKQHMSWFGLQHYPEKLWKLNNSNEVDIVNTKYINYIYNGCDKQSATSKQERIHNSALNTILGSRDKFENLSTDEFISYQIVKRRYQLGQVRYMQTRVKSIAPGEQFKYMIDKEDLESEQNVETNIDPIQIPKIPPINFACHDSTPPPSSKKPSIQGSKLGPLYSPDSEKKSNATVLTKGSLIAHPKLSAMPRVRSIRTKARLSSGSVISIPSDLDNLDEEEEVHETSRKLTKQFKGDATIETTSLLDMSDLKPISSSAQNAASGPKAVDLKKIIIRPLGTYNEIPHMKQLLGYPHVSLPIGQTVNLSKPFPEVKPRKKKSMCPAEFLQTHPDMLTIPNSENCEHKVSESLDFVIEKVSEYINQTKNIELLRKEDSGIYIKIGKDNTQQLLVLITFGPVDDSTNGYALNRIRGSQDDFQQFELALSTSIGF